MISQKIKVMVQHTTHADKDITVESRSASSHILAEKCIVIEEVRMENYLALTWPACGTIEAKDAGTIS